MTRVLAAAVRFVWCSALIIEHASLGQSWTQTTNFEAGSVSIAASADGNKLVALPYLGGVYISTNAGTTWIQVSNGPQFGLFAPIVSSADGSKLAAGRTYEGAIFISTNAGSTWTSNFVAGSSGWFCIASSAEGDKLLATPEAAGPLFTSLDGGNTWRSNNVPTVLWNGVACSANGSRFVATTFGKVYTSMDSGTTWTAYATPSLDFVYVGSSVDGNRLVAGAYQGSIYTSTNGGITWTSNHVAHSIYGAYRVACSADGIHLAGADSDKDGGQFYTSTNAGATWETNNVPHVGWCALTSSADGATLVAAVERGPYNGGGAVFLSQAVPTPTLTLTPTASNALVSWVIPSQPFTLHQNTDLTTTNWMVVTNAPALNLTNLKDEVVVPISAENVFYRLQSTP